jgi:hypothetical protein
LYATVADITGDTGSAQSGSLQITGGTSGILFDTSTASITASVDFINMPLTTATTGQIMCSSATILHNYGTAAANIFVGDSAGNFTLTGAQNTGCGSFALNVLEDGTENVAVGQASLVSLTAGGENVAVGFHSGSGLTTGSNNILIGAGAGSSYSGNESDNILVGSNPGILGESQVIRIGNGSIQACFIEGIYSLTVNPVTALPVFVDDIGTLGTVLSSAQFKNDIKPIGKDSAVILEFCPISFTAKKDQSKIKQYGLIAEEVFELMPELVVKNKQGKPHAVKYHELPVLLLNELQKLEQRVQELEDQIVALKADKQS